AGLVVEDGQVDLRAAGLLDLVDRELQAVALVDAVFGAGARQRENGAEVEGLALRQREVLGRDPEDRVQLLAVSRDLAGGGRCGRRAAAVRPAARRQERTAGEAETRGSGRAQQLPASEWPA